LITLDASCLIAFFDKNNSHHQRAVGILDRCQANETQVHTINLAELLVGALRLGQVTETIAHLEAMGVLTIRPLSEEALRLAELRHRTGLKLPDCCALLAAKTRGLTLATFDTALAKAARQQGITVID